MCCSVKQCVQCVAVCGSTTHNERPVIRAIRRVLRDALAEGGGYCCSVWQRVAVCCSVLQWVAVCGSVWQCVAVQETEINL